MSEALAVDQNVVYPDAYRPADSYEFALIPTSQEANDQLSQIRLMQDENEKYSVRKSAITSFSYGVGMLAASATVMIGAETGLNLEYVTPITGSFSAMLTLVRLEIANRQRYLDRTDHIQPFIYQDHRGRLTRGES